MPKIVRNAIILSIVAILACMTAYLGFGQDDAQDAVMILALFIAGMVAATRSGERTHYGIVFLCFLAMIVFGIGSLVYDHALSTTLMFCTIALSSGLNFSRGQMTRSGIRPEGEPHPVA